MTVAILARDFTTRTTTTEGALTVELTAGLVVELVDCPEALRADLVRVRIPQLADVNDCRRLVPSKYVVVEPSGLEIPYDWQTEGI